MRTAGAHNSMGVATRLAGSDYGIEASVGDRLSTGQAPKRVSGGDKEEPHRKNREDHCEAGFEEEKEKE